MTKLRPGHVKMFAPIPACHSPTWNWDATEAVQQEDGKLFLFKYPDSCLLVTTVLLIWSVTLNKSIDFFELLPSCPKTGRMLQIMKTGKGKADLLQDTFISTKMTPAEILQKSLKLSTANKMKALKRTSKKANIKRECFLGIYVGNALNTEWNICNGMM